jgi:hypothetical protein
MTPITCACWPDNRCRCDVTFARTARGRTARGSCDVVTLPVDLAVLAAAAGLLPAVPVVSLWTEAYNLVPPLTHERTA